jgi:hypothetical protein
VPAPAATSEPIVVVFKIAFETDETARLVVVAWEVVAFVAVNVVIVDEAVDTKPLLNSRVVDVAFSPVPRVLNGKAKVPAVGQVVRQSPARQIVPEAKVVEVALVVVLFAAVKFCKVVELR